MDKSVKDVVDSVVESFNKEFKDNTAQTLDSDSILCKINDWVPTGSMAIDKVIRGGYPKPRPIIPFGRLTEISGLNGSGKTTMLGHIGAQIQAAGGFVCIADTEHALDVKYMESLGLDLSRVILFQPDCLEDFFDKLSHLLTTIQKAAPDKLVGVFLDSVGATSTRAELSGKGGGMAEAARVWGSELRNHVALISKLKTALIFTNHMYYNVGDVYGDKYKTYGGEKIKYLATLRLRLTQKAKITIGPKEDKETIGREIEITTIKNKMQPGEKKVRGYVLFGHGFSNDYLVFKTADKLEGTEGGGEFKSSTWSTWKTPTGEEVKFQGWHGFLAKVVTHKDYPSLLMAVEDTFYS